MAKRTPEELLAFNTQKTYESRRNVLKEAGADSPEAVVASVTAVIADAPLGTALPTRAAAVRFLNTEFGLSESEASELLPSLKGKKNAKLRVALQPAQLKAYYAAVDQLPPGALHTILLLLPQTGLRPSEMLNLRKDHVREAETGYFLEVHGKSKDARLVPVSGDGATVLKQYLTTVKGPWLFPGTKPDSKTGEARPMSDQCVLAAVSGYRNRGKEFPGIAQKIGVKGLTPYVLRHTYATDLLREGTGIEVIAELLGHQDIETTRIYAKIEMTAKVAAASKVARPVQPR